MQNPQQQQDPRLENLTRDELKKIQRSMKRPQFMGLLNEYMIEISDPKNKNQYDQYLKQMEQQGELPKHMKLVKLKPEFCFRTHIVSNKNKKHQMKLFINMCSTEYIHKPQCEPAPGENGKGGYSWKVPNSMGKIRYDQDRHKNPCQVADCGFHPDTFMFASHPSFQAMIIGIALQSAQKQLGQRKQSLSRDYIILKNLKCKGQNGEPALLPIRYIEGKAYSRGQGPVQLERDLQGKETKLQKQINTQKQTYNKQNLQNKEEKAEDVQVQDLDQGVNKKLIEDLQSGIHPPRYTTIYTYKTEYSDFLDEPIPKKQRKLPNSFSVQFKVPRMQAISEASKLQINENKILFEVVDKYYIDLSFQSLKVKYPLLTAQAKAKFDKKKKILKVQIPVDVTKLEDNMIEVLNIQNSKQNEQEQQDSRYIENQTWKNKVLQIPEQTVDTKFIAQGQMKNENDLKEEKKFVEQIDQDDIVENSQNNKNEIQDNRQQQQKYLPKIFSLHDYYDKKNNETIAITQQNKSLQTLDYIFNENSKQVIVMVRMQNYLDAEVEAIYHKNPSKQKQDCLGQILIKWDNNNSSQVRILHLNIYHPTKNIKDIKLTKRVGFYVFNIEKEDSQFLGKETIINISKNYIEVGLAQFLQTFTKLQQKHKQYLMRQEQLKKSQQQKQKPTENTVKSEVHQTKLNEKMQELDEQQNRQQNKQQKQKQSNQLLNKPTSVFEKLPFQFIRFHAPFIDALS